MKSAVKTIATLPPITVGDTINYLEQQYAVTSILQQLVNDKNDEPYIDLKVFLQLIKDNEAN